jgi:hypothetical protein
VKDVIEAHIVASVRQPPHGSGNSKNIKRQDWCGPI